MGSDFRSAVRPALVMTALFAILLGVIYPLVALGLGQLLFPTQANGSLIRDGDRIVGSALIGQPFTGERYFHPRPSAAASGYDGLASSGSNLGPTSAALIERVKGDVAAQRAAGVAGAIPADLVTASGSGLDPDISPAAALAQVGRLAKVRHLPEGQLRALVERSIDGPMLGLLGEPRVNVLILNRQLDRMRANSAP